VLRSPPDEEQRMTDQDLEEMAGITLAHTALLTTLMATLQTRKVISQADVNEICDLALVGLENTDHLRPKTYAEARKVMEGMAQTMGGKLTT
jgi:hypothetical protein